MKRSVLSAAAVLFAAQLFPLALAPATQSSKASPCAKAEYHQFDFWLGDWDSFEVDSGKRDARLRVTRILDGCVIHEDYQSVSGHKGESLSVYDATRKVWHQTWVTNRGELLMIEGQFQNGEMTLSGSDLTATGEKRLVRGVWKAVHDGVRETAFASLDNGKTWKPWFDLIIRVHQHK